MQGTSRNILKELEGYGALPSQLVDTDRDDQPRVLSYLDLRASSPDWRRPVVVENAGRPCVHVFDGRDGVSDEQFAHWCWRIALRGDGAWVGVLHPGLLRVFRVDVDSQQISPSEELSARSGEWALPRFLNDVRAGQNDVARRRYLTQLLHRSARDATARGLSQTDALSLVGRGLFWRFLVDRKLLMGLEPHDVCENAKDWAHCLDGKARALRTFQWLDEVFNGGLLPFAQNPKQFDPELFSFVLGNIAHGATESGQLRLPTDWKEINFSYVPVGLLSEVYEAFAHSIDASEAAQRSIHYTPSHLVEFVVTQALAQLPPGSQPQILDPAVGAGGFLVTAFRGLVEREWQEKGERPKRKRIREILNKQLVGFDIDGRALRLAELALYLTALELDPKPKPLSELKFDDLRDNVLFDLSSSAYGSLGAVKEQFRGRFDLILGNPPWTAKQEGMSDKTAWVTHSREVVRERLGDAHAAAFDLPDTNMDLPFVWRSMEWAKEGGRIALITHARWLFGISDRSTQARNNIFRAFRVTGILNGSMLRLTSVWPEVDAPWCVLFATNELPEPFEDAAFQFVSPALDAEQDSKQARMRVDWLAAQIVPASAVVARPWELKIRFRANRLAARALESMRCCGEELGQYLQRLGTEFKNGYQVGGKTGKQLDASHMIGMPDTKGIDQLGFVVDVDALPRFERSTLLFPRDKSIYKKPLLLLRENISADRLVPRASRSDVSIVFHASYHGLSLAHVEERDFVARYLQLWLQSSLMVFVELLVDGRYGVERDAIYKESLAFLPVVPHEKLSRDQRRVAMELSEQLEKGMSVETANAIDDFILGTFGLSSVEDEAIRDTIATALPSVESKRNAVRAPSSQERKRFANVLADSLGSVLAASEMHAAVIEREDLRCNPWRVIQVDLDIAKVVADLAPPMRTFLEEADTNGASLVVARANETTWFIGLLERYALWTPTRARLLATDLIAEQSSP
ncbi:class I SAM-dependent DNA methyltransferase [Corallococcus sp. CA047B]|uniref:HsdM family class I SAM-dependent methyltransferase n=1 Tax=Corallococcus sp. CA047B TaxID=2316729 RepID=UPI0013153322|nr:N-6 DNA methylase [Corallococcus sp. CA047B]